MWRKLDEQEIGGRYAFGTDFGRARPILLRDGRKTLEIHPGHNAWVSRGQSGWYPTHLCLCDRTPQHRHDCPQKELHEGRVTLGVFREHIATIAEWFGVSVDDLPPIRKDCTYVREHG